MEWPSQLVGDPSMVVLDALESMVELGELCRSTGDGLDLFGTQSQNKKSNKFALLRCLQQDWHTHLRP